jgi:transposase
MYPPIYVQELTESEQEFLEGSLRSGNGFTLRRSQILLASAKGKKPSEIAAIVGCSVQSVRNAIHAFEQEGRQCVYPKSSRPHRTKQIFDVSKREQLKALVHSNPREYGQPRTTWSLTTLAEVAHQVGITPTLMSIETIRQALKANGLNWRRAKAWISSPDPDYEQKKRRRARLIQKADAQADWLVMFLDEVWWSRFAQPNLHSWAHASESLRLEQKQLDRDDKEAKAIACYGVWCQALSLMLLRFVDGRPVSNITCQFLEWVVTQVKTLGYRAMVMIWDNASWHRSKQVRQWLKQHNRQSRLTGGVRLLVCFLPVKSPWLNAIEPKWLHAKRAVVAPNHVLSATELQQRICDYFGCTLLSPLAKEVA